MFKSISLIYLVRGRQSLRGKASLIVISKSSTSTPGKRLRGYTNLYASTLDSLIILGMFFVVCTDSCPMRLVLVHMLDFYGGLCLAALI